MLERGSERGSSESDEIPFFCLHTLALSKSCESNKITNKMSLLESCDGGNDGARQSFLCEPLWRVLLDRSDDGKSLRSLHHSAAPIKGPRHGRKVRRIGTGICPQHLGTFCLVCPSMPTRRPRRLCCSRSRALDAANKDAVCAAQCWWHFQRVSSSPGRSYRRQRHSISAS